jgi:hypothetical protein
MAMRWMAIFRLMVVLVLWTAGTSPGQNINTVAGGGTQNPSADAVDATAAELDSPVDVHAYSQDANAPEELYIVDKGNHRILKVDAQKKVAVVAGGGTRDLTAGEAEATAVKLSSPIDVFVDSPDEFYIADTGNHRILKVAGGKIQTVAGTGTPGTSSDGVYATKAGLKSPRSVFVKSGVIYIADMGNNRILKVEGGTWLLSVDDIPKWSDFISTLFEQKEKDPPSPGTTVWGELRKVGLLSEIESASGINNLTKDDWSDIVEGLNTLLDDRDFHLGQGFQNTELPEEAEELKKSGDLSVTDNVRKLNRLLIEAAFPGKIAKSRKGQVFTVAGSGTKSLTDGAVAKEVKLNSPYDIQVSSEDEVFIAERWHHQVLKVDKQGKITTVAGTGTKSPMDGAVAKEVKLNSPVDIAMSPSGELYIADMGEQRIFKVDKQGKIFTVAGTGTPGPARDGIKAKEANLNSPEGISIDASGDLFIADTKNNRIRKVEQVAVVTSVSSDKTDGAYKADEIIKIEVTFSEIVEVDGGDPRLYLDLGEQERYATYANEGSGTEKLVFSYEVQPGDNSADLAYKNTEALVLPAGVTIKDKTRGKNAVLTLPELGKDGSLDKNKALVIDAKRPMAEISFKLAAGGTKPLYIAGDELEITATFKENLAKEPALLLAIGGEDGEAGQKLEAGKMHRKNDRKFTIKYTIKAGEGLAPVRLSGGVDRLGNKVVEKPDGVDSFPVEMPARIERVSSTSENKEYKADGEIEIEVEFDKEVKVKGPLQLKLETGDPDRLAVYSDTEEKELKTLTFKYTVKDKDTSEGLNYIDGNLIKPAGASITRGGQSQGVVLALPKIGEGSSLGENSDLVIDTKKPVVTITAPQEGKFGLNEEVIFTVKVDESLKTPPQIAIEKKAGQELDPKPMDKVNDKENTYTYIYTAKLGEGTATATVSGGADPAGNPVVAKTVDFQVVSAPVIVRVHSETDDGSYTVGAPIDIRVVFNKEVAVTGTGKPRLKLEVGNERFAEYEDGTGTRVLIFNYEVGEGDTSPDLSYSAKELDLNGGSIKGMDFDQNALPGLPEKGSGNALGDENSLVIDTKKPTATVSIEEKKDKYVLGETVILKAKFDESLKTPPVITIEGAGQGRTETMVPQGNDEYTYDHTVKTGTGGTATVTFQGGTDLAGNQMEDRREEFQVVSSHARISYSSLQFDPAASPQVVATGLNQPFDLWISGDDLFVSEMGENRVLKLRKDPQDPQKPQIPEDDDAVVTGLQGVTGIFVSGDDLFVADPSTKIVYKVNKNELTSVSDEKAVVTGLGGPRMLFVSGDDLFVSDQENKAVYRVNKNAKTAAGDDNIAAHNLLGPFGLLVSGETLYIGDQTFEPEARSSVLGVPKDKKTWVTNSNILISQLFGPFDLFASGNDMFIVDQPSANQANGSVLRVPKGQRVGVTQDNIVYPPPISSPRSLFVAGDELYVVEQGRNQILKWKAKEFRPGDKVTLVANFDDPLPPDLLPRIRISGAWQQGNVKMDLVGSSRTEFTYTYTVLDGDGKAEVDLLVNEEETILTSGESFQVKRYPAGKEGYLYIAGDVVEPVPLPTTELGKKIPVLDFILRDSGPDYRPLEVTQLQVLVGTNSDVPLGKIRFFLEGPYGPKRPEPGILDVEKKIITFPGFVVKDRTGQVCTVLATFDDSKGLVEGQVLYLGVLKYQNIFLDQGGSMLSDGYYQVDNNLGSRIVVEATRLSFAESPGDSDVGKELTPQPVVQAQDEFGNVDRDFSGQVTLTTKEFGGQLSGNITVQAVEGVARFAGVEYKPPADGRFLTLRADDQVQGDLDLPMAKAGEVWVRRHFTLPLRQGWTLCALPLKSRDPSSSALMPDHIWCYEYKERYQEVGELQPGTGYMVYNPIATPMSFWGQLPAEESAQLSLVPGWNLIGGGLQTVDVAALHKEYPSKLVIIFELGENGYRVASELEPGKGYWVLWNPPAGEKILDLRKGMGAAVGKPLASLPGMAGGQPPGALLWAEADGQRREVWLDAPVKRLLALPPVLPGAGLDLRVMVDGRETQVVPPLPEGVELPVRVQGQGVTLGWELAPGEDAAWELVVDGAVHPAQAGREIRLDDSSAEILLRRASFVPRAFALAPNFPNPFNPSTAIQYDLQKGCRVKLRVYDLLGQVVVELVNGWQEGGRYQVTWNGRDGDGAEVGNGLYVCELVAGEFRARRKMLLAK